MKKLTEAEKQILYAKIEKERLRRWELMMLDNVSVCDGCGKATAFEPLVPYKEVEKRGLYFYQGQCIHCKHIAWIKIKNPTGDY